MEEILKTIIEKLEKSNQELIYIKNKIKEYETNNKKYNVEKDNNIDEINRLKQEKQIINEKINKIDRNINHYDNLINNYNNNEKKIKNYIESLI